MGFVDNKRDWQSQKTSIQRTNVGIKRNQSFDSASMLKDLEKEDLIQKEVFREIPPRVEYSLSTRGKELREAIIPLIKWATKKGNYSVHCSCSLIRK